MRKVHLDVFASNGMIAPCTCGNFFEVLASMSMKEMPLGSAGQSIKMADKPIYSVGCLRCKTVFAPAGSIKDAVDNYIMEVRA